jgi:hypothetical protein
MLLFEQKDERGTHISILAMLVGVARILGYEEVLEAHML